MDRRNFVIAAAAMTATFRTAARAAEMSADDGSPITNFRIPAELDPMALPGLVTIGNANAEVVLCEMFDYNCGFCREAAAGLNDVVEHDGAVRLALVNNPILSAQSVQAAKVQQAVLRHFGPASAYDLHLRLFQQKGRIDGPRALAVVREMGLDATLIESASESAEVKAVLDRQRRLAADLGLSVTPSFALGNTALVGWPGLEPMRRFIAATRQCGAPSCG
jgi:protein-disulfide isomerase